LCDELAAHFLHFAAISVTLRTSWAIREVIRIENLCAAGSKLVE
jgi:hypothetical protein